jgi:hypothetical protein
MLYGHASEQGSSCDRLLAGSLLPRWIDKKFTVLPSSRSDNLSHSLHMNLISE